MSAAAKILDAGFALSVEGDRLKVYPSGKLTDEQRQFLIDNKLQIIAELEAVSRWRFTENGIEIGLNPTHRWR